MQGISGVHGAMRNEGIAKRHFAIIVIVIAVKVVVAATTPLSWDFGNLVHGAMFASNSLLAGRLDFYGPYTPSFYMLSPFFTLWLRLPIHHLPLEAILNAPSSPPTVSSVTLVGLIKTPLLIFDMLIGLVIYRLSFRLTGSTDRSLWALLVWLLNPLTTVVVEAFGQIDVVATFFVLAALLSLVWKRVCLSAASMAIATLLRWYPAFLLPFMLLAVWRERGIMRFGAVFITFLATGLAPFLALMGSSLIHQILYYPTREPAMLYFLGMKLVDPAYGMEVGPTVVIWAILFLYIQRRWVVVPRRVIQCALAVLLVFFAFGVWHRYYSVWVMPLIALEAAADRSSRRYHLLLMGTLTLYVLTHWDFTSSGRHLFFFPAYTANLVDASRLLLAFHQTMKELAMYFKSIFASATILYIIKTLIMNDRAALS